MATIEFNDVEEFKKAIGSLKAPEKYNMFRTWRDEIFLRPRSSSDWDTLYMKGLTLDQFNGIFNAWQFGKFKVKEVHLERDFRQMVR